MNQFLTRKIIGDNYEYRILHEYFDENALEKGKKKLDNSFITQTRDWDTQKNSEWVLRNYLAIKMIMSSTVMLTSLEYGNERNLKVVDPYLTYYSLLNLSRAVLFTNPNALWNEGKLINSTHSKIINIVGDAVGQFDKQIGSQIKGILEKARDYRELYSYKFPSTGITDFKIESSEAISISTLLAEVAQFQSEVLEKRVLSKDKIIKEFDHDILELGFTYELKTYDFIDQEDQYRLDYIVRKQPFPTSLYLTLTEGFVDDFFGAWCPEDSETDDYNPDLDNSLIFQMP
ncbi:MAG: hypothetical protein HUJ22_02260 [Gracilimonas sp.]|uniref:hypothetical protein n=1 Tax=Gracilimonas sp. TaxID=1974203 RepID=UPI0019AC1701|nr:hypothetical protein [Gracilimonas sp.]MBD3615368.1 hypothetical protein [Gracilimonas sp.]